MDLDCGSPLTREQLERRQHAPAGQAPCDAPVQGTETPEDPAVREGHEGAGVGKRWSVGGRHAAVVGSSALDA